MSGDAAVIISTIALLAVAVMAGAAGSAVATLRAAVESLRSDQARDRASIAALRAAVRRIDREAPELDAEPDDEPEPRIGFRPP